MKTLLVLFTFCGSVFATSQQAFLGSLGPTSSLSNSATGYVGITFIANAGGEQAVGPNSYAMFPTAGTLSNFYVNLSGSPGAAKQYVFSVYQNGSVPSNSLAVTLTGASGTASTQQSDTTHTVAVAAGDLICIQKVPTGTPTAVSASWGMIFTPAIAGETVLFGSFSSPGIVGFVGLSAPQIANTTEPSVTLPIPGPGTLKKLFFQSTIASGAATSYILTLNKNASGTALTVTSANSTALLSDLTHTVSVSAGDYIDGDVTITGSPASTSLYIGVVFVPSVQGQFIIGTTRTVSGFSNSANNFMGVSGRWPAASATEANFQEIGLAMKIQAMAALWQSASALGNGATWTFTLRNATSSTALNTVITGTGASGVLTHATSGASVSIANYDLLDTLFVASAGAQVPSVTATSYMGYIAPTGLTTHHKVVSQ